MHNITHECEEPSEAPPAVASIKFAEKDTDSIRDSKLVPDEQLSSRSDTPSRVPTSTLRSRRNFSKHKKAVREASKGCEAKVLLCC